MEEIEEEVRLVDSGLIVNEDIRSYMYDTSKWAKFLSIVGFVFATFMIMTAFSAGTLTKIMEQDRNAAAFGNLSVGAIGGMFFIYAFLIFYPSLLLYKYANTAKKAVLYGDQEAFMASFSKMKSYFKFLGILTIVGLSMYFIVLVTVAVGLSAIK